MQESSSKNALILKRERLSICDLKYFVLCKLLPRNHTDILQADVCACEK